MVRNSYNRTKSFCKIALLLFVVGEIITTGSMEQKLFLCRLKQKFENGMMNVFILGVFRKKYQ